MKKEKGNAFALAAALIITLSLYAPSACAFPEKEAAPKPDGPTAAKTEELMKPGDGLDRSAAYDYYLQAVLAERAGDYPAAIRLYNKAAQRDETSSQALRHGAELYLRIGEVGKAQDTAEECVAINSESIECLDILAGINTSLGATEKAAGYLERIIKLDPEDTGSVVALAVAHLQSGAPEKAIDILQGKASASPHQNVYQKYFLGRAHMAAGNYAKAVEVFAETFRQRPDFTVVFENLCWAYRVTGEWDKAIDLYEKYLAVNATDMKTQADLEKTISEKESGKTAEEMREEILMDQPKEIDYRFFLGMTKWQQGEMMRDMGMIQKALAQFQLVRAADPESQTVISYIASIFESLNLLKEAVSAWKQIATTNDSEKKSLNLKIADLYDRMGDYEMSLKHALVAVKLDQEDPELKFLAGFMYGKLKKYNDAIKLFQAAQDMNPNDPKYHFHLGVTYEKLKKYDQCIEMMKQVIALKPDHSNALNYLGYIYAEQNINLGEAEKYLLQAIDLEPTNGYFIDSLGWLYYKKKMYKEALAQLLVAVRNITPDPTVLEHLGDVYSAMGRIEDAANTYQRSLDAKVYDDRVLDREATRVKLEAARKIIEGTNRR